MERRLLSELSGVDIDVLLGLVAKGLYVVNYFVSRAFLNSLTSVFFSEKSSLLAVSIGSMRQGIFVQNPQVLVGATLMYTEERKAYNKR